MGLTVSDLLPDYRASLNDAAAVFGGGSETTNPADISAAIDANLTRHLRIAARALSADGKRPLLKSTVLTVVADQATYSPAPEDMIVPRTALWSSNGRPQWEQPPPPVPAVYALDSGSVDLSPAPTAEQIRFYGAQFRYTYLAGHAITDDASTSTLTDADRNLLILRAQVEAMREMAFRNIHKPVSMRNAGGGSMPSNMSPSALFEVLMNEYKAAV